jgi:PAS domain S-box-containing protein
MPAVTPAPDAPAAPPPGHTRAVTAVVLAYAAGALIWFALAGAAVDRLAADPATATRLHVVEVLAFVGLTAALLYGLLHAWAGRVRRAAHAQAQALQRERQALGLLQALADGSPDAIFAKDAQGRYLLFNPAAARLTGVRAEDVIGHDDSAIFPPDQAAMIRANDRRVMQQDAVQTFEEVLDTVQGRRSFQAIKGPLKDGGRVMGLFGISRDVTDIAQTRLRSEASGLAWRRLFKANPAPMWVVDIQTLRFVAVNQAAEIKYGYSRDEFLSMTLADIRPPQHRAALQTVVAERRRTAATGYDDLGTWVHRTKDGRELEMEVTSNDLEFNGRPARLVLMHDVTDQNRLRREREAAHQRLADVLARIADGFIALDAQDRFVYANQRAATLLAVDDPAGLLGQVLRDRLGPNLGADFLRACDQARASGQPQVVEAFHPGWDRWHEYRLHPSPAGTTVYFSDVSDRKRAEARLHQRDEALRLSEQRYRLAAAGGHVWDWDLASGLTRIVTPFWAQLGLETPPDGQARQALAAHMHPDDVAQWQSAVRDHLRHRVPYRLQFRMQHADGSWRWFATQGQAVWDARGRATYMAGTTFDMTAQHHAEQALLNSQAELTELTQRLMDQERITSRQLAQALHDELGQMLASCRLNLDLALADAPGLEPLRRASTLVDEAVREVRRVLMRLRPPLLESQGLAASLDNEVRSETAAAMGVALSLQVAPAARQAPWPDRVAHTAFMIAREAIGNALRHAGARSIEVRLDGPDDGSALTLRIRDDGSGIAAEALTGRPGHLGLVGMRERALAIGARLLVQARTEGGTEVLLQWEASAR